MSVALITGSSRGLGAAMAIRLAKDGVNTIIINSHSQESLNQSGVKVQKTCESFGAQTCALACDVSSYADCEKMINEIKNKFGRLDILVNNAGIVQDGLLVRMKEEAFDKVTKVNYKSVFNLTKLAGTMMMRQKSGCIVNVSSVAGVHGNSGQFNYSAAKAGIIGMTKSAAKELGPRNIRVNAIAPGFIDTDMTASLPPEYKEKIKEQIALKRYGTPEEVASVVSFLVSEDASYINGQTIIIDGCLSM